MIIYILTGQGIPTFVDNAVVEKPLCRVSRYEAPKPWHECKERMIPKAFKDGFQGFAKTERSLVVRFDLSMFTANSLPRFIRPEMEEESKRQ